MHSVMFPSFAASPSQSPKANKLRKQVNFNDEEIHKISIHLPQSMVESTFEENNFFDETKENSKSNDNIQVYCRFRPSIKFSSDLKYDHEMIDDGENCYTFDSIFGKYSEQAEVYDGVGKRHIESFFKGKNSTIFAYGQTGSGKTYTMFGDLKERDQFGIIPRALDEIFNRDLNDDVITCSMLQIYNEKLIDLFNPIQSSSQEIKLKEINNNVYLEGLIEVTVENKEEILNLIKVGHRGRKIATTYNNDFSSRSHTILFVYRNFICEDKEYKCKLCFIDLAGSEKVRKSGVKGQHLEETKKINLSLSCLGNVVFALTNSSEHIPYRNSKLTRILKDSLSGDTRTSIVTTCSLERTDMNQTISTVKFAIRAKKIKNRRKLSTIQYTMEEVVENLKKQLADTKKQLDWYKQKQQYQEEERKAAADIPEESVSCLPIKFSCVNGGVGITSRVKMISTSYTE